MASHGYMPRRSGKSYGLSRTPWSAHCGVWPDGRVGEAVSASNEGKAAVSQPRKRSWLRNSRVAVTGDAGCGRDSTCTSLMEFMPID